MKAGICDCLIWYRGRTIAVELKSPYGQCRPAQRLVREQMLQAGIKAWWQCRTAESAMWAIAKSGVKYRAIVHEDGWLKSWQQPPLEPWEIPKTDPRERRPGPRFTGRRRWRWRRRRAKWWQRVTKPHRQATSVGGVAIVLAIVLAIVVPSPSSGSGSGSAGRLGWRGSDAARSCAPLAA